MSAPEPLALKFAKMFYESPLILLLCGSAVVSAIMGNVDDAISITIAVVIVLTGMPLIVTRSKSIELTPSTQSASCRNDVLKSPSRHSTSSSLITVT